MTAFRAEKDGNEAGQGTPDRFALIGAGWADGAPDRGRIKRAGKSLRHHV